MLKGARIESCEKRDDDWIEFSFSEPDPAISPFPKITSTADGGRRGSSQECIKDTGLHP